MNENRKDIKNYCLSLVAASADSSGTGAAVGISGYSSLAPSSQVNMGQQLGNGAVLFVLPKKRNKLGYI